MLWAILGALVGGAYEAFQTFELLRTGAYSLAQGIGIVLAGAAACAILFAAVSAALAMYLARKNESANG